MSSPRRGMGGMLDIASDALQDWGALLQQEHANTDHSLMVADPKYPNACAFKEAIPMHVLSHLASQSSMF